MNKSLDIHEERRYEKDKIKGNEMKRGG